MSLLHQLLSVVRTIGFRRQSAPFFTSCGDGCIIQCDRPSRREIKIFAKSNVDSSSLRTLEVAEFNDAAEKHSKGVGIPLNGNLARLLDSTLLLLTLVTVMSSRRLLCLAGF